MTYWYWFHNKNPSRILGVRVSKELPQSAMPLNLSQNRLQVITVTTQPAFTSPKSTMDTPEQCVKSIWSQQWKKEREKIDVNPRLHGLLWTDFTKFSGISTACFGQVIAAGYWSGWFLTWRKSTKLRITRVNTQLIFWIRHSGHPDCQLNIVVHGQIPCKHFGKCWVWKPVIHRRRSRFYKYG